jgi:hypothetical protein
MKVCLYGILAICLTASLSMASEITVGAIGNGGWYADDTRSPDGTDLVGTNYTHAGKPGQTPTTADDAAIANQIQFVGDAPGNVDALKLTFAAGTGSGKVTISNINTDTGFATGNWQNGFFANMSRYRPENTRTTLKIGIQSTNWAASQAGFTPKRTGDSAYDLTLVYTGDEVSSAILNAWESINLTSTHGQWKLYKQDGNSYFDNLVKPNTFPKGNNTLAVWAADPTWGPLLFGEGAMVTSIQLGAGSFNVASTGYIDYLETSLLNGGDRINFVPEPATMALMGLGGLFFARKKK